jgi:integrase
MKALHAPKPTLRKDRKKDGGGIYRCDGRVELTPGRSVRITATGGTKQEAKTAWIERAERARSGVITDRIAAGDYFNLWLNKKRGQVANATVKRYEVVINNHLNRHFNGVLLADIRRSDIEALVASAQGELRSATIQHVVATISSILSSAVNDGVIARSPASRIPVAPDAQERPHPMVDPRQMLELLERQQPCPRRDLLKVLTVIPLRLNEVRGLQLGDFTKDFAEVHITQSATRDPVPERKMLKTRSGRHVRSCWRPYSGT